MLVPEKEYQPLQKKAALKTKPQKLLSLSEAKAYSKKLINKWAALSKKNKGEDAFAFWENNRKDIYQDYLK